jgi:hypothetical protein
MTPPDVPPWLFQDVPLWAFLLALLTTPSTWARQARNYFNSDTKHKGES